jgi:hypothetical protein
LKQEGRGKPDISKRRSRPRVCSREEDIAEGDSMIVEHAEGEEKVEGAVKINSKVIIIKIRKMSLQDKLTVSSFFQQRFCAKFFHHPPKIISNLVYY